jgi:PAS domain S-box-containing protein
MKTITGEELEQHICCLSFAGGVFLVMDRGFVVKSVSPGLEYLSGCGPGDLVGRPLRDSGLIHPDDLERAMDDLLALLSGRAGGQAAYRLQSKDGGKGRTVEVMGIPVTAGGRVEAVLALAREVGPGALDPNNDHACPGRFDGAVRRSCDELELFRFMVEGSREEVYLFRPDGSLAYANPQAARSLGRKPSEMCSLSVVDFDTEHGPRFHEVFDRVKGGDECLFTTVHLTRDERVLHKEIKCSLVAMEGKDYICWFGRDITGRTMTEAELIQGERRFRDLAENTSDIVWETDQELRFTYMNRTVMDNLGYDPEERIGKTLLELIPPDQASMLGPVFRSLAGSPRAFHDVEYRAIHKDGSVRVRQASGVPVYDAKGVFRGYRGITRDITDKKRVEELLKASEKRFSAVFSASPLPLLVSRPGDVRIMDCNRSFERWSGYGKNEVVGRSSLDIGLWIDGDDRRRLMERVEEDGLAESLQTRWRLRDGSERDVMLTARLIDVDGDGFMLTQVVDITVRRRMEDDLRESRRTLSAAFHESPAPMAITRLSDGVILDVNKSCLLWSGCSSDEVLGGSSGQLGFWADPAQKDKVDGDMLAHGRVDSREVEFRIRGGEIRKALYSARIIEVNSQPCILSHIHDVTDTNRAERELRRSEALLRGIVENFPGVVFQLYVKDNGERGLSYLSGNTIDVLGMPNDTEGFLDRALSRLGPEERVRFEDALDEAVQSRGMLDITSRFVKPQGDEIFIRCISRPELRGTELVFSGVLLDVTMRHRLNNELALYRGRLEEMVLSRTAEFRAALGRLKREIETRKDTEARLRQREMELENRRTELEEMNAALRVLLKQREEDRSSMETSVLSNVKTLVLPYIERLQMQGMPESHSKSLDMIKAHLEGITSSFARSVSSEYLGLTPAEMQVASLIRDGRSSKEIAGLLGVSFNTVQTHRYHIRKKAKLKNKKLNLCAYLNTLEHPMRPDGGPGGAVRNPARAPEPG